MAQSLIFHYRDSSSFLNKTNPFIKLLSLLLFCSALVKTSILGTLLFLFCVAIIMIIIKLPLIKYGSELLFFIVISIFIAITSYLAKDPLILTINKILRFDTAILISFLLADSTDPSDIARSLAKVLNHIPFINGWKLASQIELTLMCIPLIFDVNQAINEARIARLEKRYIHPIKFISSYSIHLLDNLLYKVDDIAFALDSRGYDPLIERESQKYKINDFVFLFFVVLLIGVGLYVK
jgi:energy-coupling factor transport system permease protein